MKRALITGGMSGLWKQLAYIALEKWYKVDVLDISRGEIDEIPQNMNYIHSDISKIDDTLGEKLSEKYDMVMCNAGISLSGNFIDHSYEDNKRLMNINTLWHMELIRILITQKRLQRWGSIWFIASASEMLPFPIALWYSASKGALRAFAVSLRSYLIGTKVSVSVVYPWPMPTAHVKYYGKEISHNEKNLKKIRSIAKKVLRWTEKWKRNIYPDMVSKILTITNPFNPILDRVMFRSYKKDIT